MNRSSELLYQMVFVLVLAIQFAPVLAAKKMLHDWRLAKTDFDADKLAALDEAIESGEYKKIKSIIVIRDGELLVDRYYNGAGPDITHNPRSVGKTFLIPVLGIAIAEGYIKSLDQPLGDFYDLKAYENYSEKKSRVTLRHLVTMTSGFNGYDFERDSPGNEENMYPQADWVLWTLNLPMAEDRNPGGEWRYFTAGIVVLGDIINQAVPGGLETYAHKKFFSRIGITNYQWQYTPQHVVNTAGGIALTPLDFAKFGELHRNNGRWQGEVVVPRNWVSRALLPDIQTTITGNRYGYLWWHKTYHLNGELLPTSYCSGNGGNKIFVFDDRKLVIVVTASAYGKPYMHTQVDEMMTEYILPAVMR